MSRYGRVQDGAQSIRATVQACQRKKLWLQGRPVYSLPTHYCQTWQHLPDYGAYHATLIAAPALPGKWQPGEDVVYILIFERDLTDGVSLEEHAYQVLPPRLFEALPIPILKEWADTLWKTGVEQDLIGEFTTGGDSIGGFWVNLTEVSWSKLLSSLLREQMVKIT